MTIPAFTILDEDGRPLRLSAKPCDWHRPKHFIKAADGVARCFECGYEPCDECGGHGKDYNTEAEYRGDADPTGTCSLCGGRGVVR